MSLTPAHFRPAPPAPFGAYVPVAGGQDARRRGLLRVRPGASRPASAAGPPSRARALLDRVRAERLRFARRLSCHVGPAATVRPSPARASRVTGLVVKISRAVPGGAASQGPAAAAFLESARVQRGLPSSTWAPILDCGMRGDAAFYVTREYDASVDSLVDTAARLDARGIRAIAGGVVRGLLDLRRAAGRAHGNLRPSNVLIRGRRGRVAVVVLSDPAAAVAADPATAERDDLRALGAMLRDICRLAADPPGAAGGAAPSRGRLRSWLDACDRLTDPLAARPLTRLDDVAAEFRRQARRDRAGSFAAILASALVIAGVCGAAITALRR